MSSSRTLLVVGATGALGGAVAAVAHDRGWTVRALVRDPARLPPALARRLTAIAGDARDPAAVRRALAGADAVFSCAGASVLPALGHGWRGFRAVDTALHRVLVDEAAAARIGRFVYVSVFHGGDPGLRRLAYVDAHERVVEQLRERGVAHAVVRPTGFHSALASYVDLAARGAIPEVGGGRARTNPIADADLAVVCADALASSHPALELDCGGPEVVTRREIAEAAFAALGRPVRLRRVPAVAMGAATWLGRPFHPRICQFLRFLAAISTRDLIAPPHGRRRLRDAFADRALSLAAA